MTQVSYFKPSEAPTDAKPRPPLTARGEATRRRLLDAAEKEFGEKGFHAASVSAIVTRALVSQGTFYIYFRSKEEIFAALVRAIGQALRRHMGDAVRGRPGACRMEAERAGLEAFLEFTQRHPGLYRIVQEAQFVDERVFREYYERVAAGYSRALEEAGARGELKPGDPVARAWAIMGIGHFLGLRYCLWQGTAPPAAIMDEVVALLAHGMAAGPDQYTTRPTR